MANENFLDYILENAPEEGSFKPAAVYIDEGDKLVAMLEDVDYNAHRIDDVLTVYRADNDDRVVGFGIKGVTHLLERLEDFDLTYPKENVTIKVIIGAYKIQRPLELANATEEREDYLGEFYKNTGIDDLQISLPSYDPEQ